MSDFTERLNDVMRARGISATDLADATGLSKSRISHYVNGRYEPKSDALLKIAATLNVDEHWLLGSDSSEDELAKDQALCNQIQLRYGKTTLEVVHNMENMNEAGQLAVKALSEDLREVYYYKRGFKE